MLRAQPTEGITAEGFERIERPADLARISLTVISLSESSASAETTLKNRTLEVIALLRTNGMLADSLAQADRPVSVDSGNPRWRAACDLQANLPRETLPKLLDSLRTLPFVTLQSVTPSSSQIATLQTLAIERATAKARRKAEAAARQLGFALGTAREIRVLDATRREESAVPSSALIGVDAKVTVRYALVPATSQAEVLAIAAAKENNRVAKASASSTTSSAPAEPTAVAVEIVSATYDSSGRGRFVTAAGTVWREVVPTPVQQRLKNGRTYRGSVTAGIFGGYRMELAGVPRILKVEPVADKRP